MTLSDAKKLGLLTRHTLGYLVYEDTERVVIAQTFDPAQPDEEEDGVGDVTVIPAGWVQRPITILRPSRRRTPSDSCTSAPFPLVTGP